MEKVYMERGYSFFQKLLAFAPKIHLYDRRIEDNKNNAKRSYIFDSRIMHEIKKVK